MAIDTFQLGDTWRQDFTTSNPTSGAAQDADTDPDIEIYEDGDATPIVSGTASKRDAGTTGQYTFGTTLSSGAGFEVGKTYNAYAIAAVGGTTGKSVIGTFRIQAQAIYVG